MGKNVAITIGINQYRYLQDLKFAKRDAESMRDFFKIDLTCDEVYHFTEESPGIQQLAGPPLASQPTYTTLKRFLSNRFEQSFLAKGDTLWFFFAGHGIRHAERDYLLPSDGYPKDIDKTALSVNEVTEALRCSGAGNVFLFVDACRYRGVRSGNGIGGEEQRQGVISIFSCSPHEYSYEIEAIQQGAFTHILLEGLRNQEKRNCATVERLYNYLRHQVPKLNEAHGKDRQTPYGVMEPQEISHMILLPTWANDSDVRTLKEDASRVEERGEVRVAEQLWSQVLGASPDDTQANKAISRISGAEEKEVPKPESILNFKIVKVNTLGQEVTRQISQTQSRVLYLEKDTLLTILAIPGGRFLMGSPESEVDREDGEGPHHLVSVKPFWMSQSPITQAQWRCVSSFSRIERDLDPNPSRFQGDNYPVECVSWLDSIEFSARLAKKYGWEFSLPSEAQWEYACRSGTRTPFHFGETLNVEIANYNSQYTYKLGPKSRHYAQSTVEVGRYPCNDFGLKDLHGNVWEWCMDCWHDTYEGAPNDESPWLENQMSSCRVLRGGSWNRIPSFCRSATRYFLPPNTRQAIIGLRIVC